MRRQLAGAALFLVLAVVELWTPITHGGDFMAADLGQLWSISHAPGPGLPVNSLESDVYTQLMPFMHFAVDQVRAGHLPTWNPYSGNGQPFLANYQSAVFSPFTTPFYVAGFRMALIISALARFWLLGFFTFMFLRRHRLGDIASIVGAVIFTFAGYHIVWLNYPITSVSAWLPLALWCARVALDHRAGDKDARRKRNIATIGLAVSVAAMLVAGNPETATFDILLIVGYVAAALVIERVAWRTAGGYLVRFAAAGALSVGLASVQLIPFAQYEQVSTAAMTHRSAIPGFNLSTVPIMGFPNLFGGPQFSYVDSAFYTRYLHPPTNYAELDGNSVGLVAMCIAPIGLITLRRRRRAVLPWFGVGAAVVGTLLLYSHAAGVIWEHIPIVHTAYLNRSQDVQLMGLAVLAALGTDWVVRTLAGWRTHPRQSWHGLLAFAGTVSVISVALTMWGLVLRQHVSRIAGIIPASAPALRLVHRQVLTELALVLAFFVTVSAFALLRRSRPLRLSLAVAVVVTVFASTGLVLRSYNPTVPSSLSYPLTPAVRQLKAVVGSGEVLFTGNAFAEPATNLWFGIHDVGSYDSVGLRWHDDLYRRVFHTPNTRVEQMPTCLAGLQLFGVNWVVGGDGRLGNGVALARAGTIDGIPYYAVPVSSPYAIVGSPAAAAGDSRALQLVSGCGFDSSDDIVLDSGSSGPNGSASGPTAAKTTRSGDSVRRISGSASSVVLATSSSAAGWLLVRESWAPGWRATIDGHSEVVQRADFAFMGLRLPPGHHVIHLSYGL